MRKLLNERTGCLIAGQCEKEKAFGAASEGLFYSLCAAGLEVYQRIKSFHNAQGFTLKQPHDNVRYYSHSIASVLPSRHSSCAQFSASTRNACRRMTRCRVSSASGTKAGTTSKTFFKLRALSFCFCPKVRGGSPLEARWRRKRPF